MSDDEQITITAESMFGFMTGRGLVTFGFGDQKANLTPAKARGVAVMLIEAAGAAEGDEALCHVLKDIGGENEHMAGLLLAFRRKREELARQREAEDERA